MNGHLKKALFMTMMHMPTISRHSIYDTSADSPVYNSKFYNSEKSIQEAIIKRYKKAVKRGYDKDFVEWLKENEE